MRGNGRRTRHLVTGTRRRTGGVVRSTRGRTRSVVASSHGSTSRLTRGAGSRLGLFTNRTMGTLGSRVTAVIASGVIATPMGRFTRGRSFLGTFVMTLTSR